MGTSWHLLCWIAAAVPAQQAFEVDLRMGSLMQTLRVLKYSGRWIWDANKGALMNDNCLVECFELGELASESVVLGVWQHKKAKVKTRKVKVDVETKAVEMVNGKSENENEQRACL